MTETLVATFIMWIFSFLFDERSVFGRFFLGLMFILIPVVAGGVYVDVLPGFIIKDEFSTFLTFIPDFKLSSSSFFKVLSLTFLGALAYLADIDTMRTSRSHAHYYFLLIFVVLLTLFQKTLISFMALFEIILLVEIFAISDKSFRFLMTRRRSVLAASIILLMVASLSSELSESGGEKVLFLASGAWLIINGFFKNQALSNWGPKKQSGFYWFAMTAKYFLLMEFINQKLLGIESYDSALLIKFGWIMALLTLVAQWQRKRLVGRVIRFEYIRSLLLGVFGVAGTLSLLYPNEIFEICGLFVLFTGISILSSLYSYEITEKSRAHGRKFEAILFLFPSLFVIGIPLTFGQVFFSWAWGKIFTISGGLFVVMFATYLHTIVSGFKHFTAVMLDEKENHGISIIWGKREVLWFLSIMGISLLNLIFLKFYIA